MAVIFHGLMACELMPRKAMKKEECVPAKLQQAVQRSPLPAEVQNRKRRASSDFPAAPQAGQKGIGGSPGHTELLL